MSDVILVPMRLEDARGFVDSGTRYSEVLEAIGIALNGNSKCDCRLLTRSAFNALDENTEDDDLEVNQLQVAYCAEERCGRELGNTL